MVQRIVSTLTDDFTGEEGAETVTFAFQGTSYEIDLNPKNSAALEKALAKYMAHGRRTSKPKRRSAGANPEIKAIREWLRSKGIGVGNTGRIAKPVAEAYGRRDALSAADRALLENMREDRPLITEEEHAARVAALTSKSKNNRRRTPATS